MGIHYSRIINTVVSYTNNIRYRYNVSSRKCHWSRSKISLPSSRTSTLRSRGSREASSSFMPVRAKSSSSFNSMAISFCGRQVRLARTPGHNNQRTFSLLSICLTASPSEDVQLGGGLPSCPAYTVADWPPFTMPQRLLSPSYAGSASVPVNR